MPVVTHKFGQIIRTVVQGAVSDAFGVGADVAEFVFLDAFGGVNFC